MRTLKSFTLIALLIAVAAPSWGQIVATTTTLSTPPTPVMEVKARKAWQKTLTANWNLNDWEMKIPFQIPSGKILVVEYVSSNSWMDNMSPEYGGSFPSVLTLMLETKVDGVMNRHWVPFAHVNRVYTTSKIGFVAGQNVTIYHEGGATSANVVMGRAWNGYFGQINVTISGYLLDAN